MASNFFLVCLFLIVFRVCFSCGNFCPDQDIWQIISMENEDWKWNVGYQQSSVFSLNQPTGSQFLFEACPYAEDHSSFAGQVSIRYLPHYWWTGDLTERLLVCQDVDGSLTIGRLAVGDGIHHPDGFKFANTSCCFKMIRDKWYPNTVVFGVTTIDSSLEYIQQVPILSNFRINEAVSVAQRIASSFRLKRDEPDISIHDWVQVGSTYIRLVYHRGTTMENAAATASDICENQLKSKVFLPMNALQVENAAAYLEKWRIPHVWLNVWSQFDEEEGATLWKSLTNEHLNYLHSSLPSSPPQNDLCVTLHFSTAWLPVQCNETISAFLCQTDNPSDNLDFTASIENVVLKKSTLARPFVVSTANVIPYSNDSLFVDAVVSLDFDMPNIPYAPAQSYFVDFILQRKHVLVQLGRAILEPVCGLGRHHQRISVKVNKNLFDQVQKNIYLCGLGADVVADLRPLDLRQFTATVSPGLSFRMNRLDSRRFDAWSICVRLHVPYVWNQDLITDEFEYITLTATYLTSDNFALVFTGIGSNLKDDQNDATVQVSITLPTTTWNHICFVKSGDFLSTYVNGAFRFTTEGASSLLWPEGDYLTIGEKLSEITWYINDLSTWSKPLSDDAINAMTASCDSRYVQPPDVILWSLKHVPSSSDLLFSNAVTLASPCGDFNERRLLATQSTFATVFCNKDFLDIPLFKIRYPRDYVRYTDAIWTNIDTNLYLDFTITNLYDFDFFAIETSVVVKAYLTSSSSSPNESDLKNNDVTKAFLLPESVRFRSLKQAHNLSITNAKLTLDFEKVAFLQEQGGSYLHISFQPCDERSSDVAYYDWFSYSVAHLLRSLPSEDIKDIEVSYFSISPILGERAHVTSHILVKSPPDGDIEVISYSLTLWYAQSDDPTAYSEFSGLYLSSVGNTVSGGDIGRHVIDDTYSIPVMSNLVDYCGPIYAILKAQLVTSVGEIDTNNNYMVQKVTRSCTKDVFAVSDLARLSVGHFAYRFPTTVTMSLTLTCSMYPKCYIPTASDESSNYEFQLYVGRKTDSSDSYYSTYAETSSVILPNQRKSFGSHEHDNSVKIYFRYVLAPISASQLSCDSTPNYLRVVIRPGTALSSDDNVHNDIAHFALQSNTVLCSTDIVTSHIVNFAASCNNWMVGTHCPFNLLSDFTTIDGDLVSYASDAVKILQLRMFIARRINEIALDSNMTWLSYSSFGAKVLHNKMTTSENIKKLQVTVRDRDGVFLDAEAAEHYCGSGSELCITTGNWVDVTGSEIADDGTIKCSKVVIECPTKLLVFASFQLMFKESGLSAGITHSVEVSGAIRNAGREAFILKAIDGKPNFKFQFYLSKEKYLNENLALEVPSAIQFSPEDLFRLSTLSGGSVYQFTSASLAVHIPNHMCEGNFVYLFGKITSWKQEENAQHDSTARFPVKINCFPDMLDHALTDLVTIGNVTATIGEDGEQLVEYGDIKITCISEIRRSVFSQDSSPIALKNIPSLSLPSIRFYLSTDTSLDIKNNGKNNDHQLLSSTIAGNIVFKSRQLSPIVSTSVASTWLMQRNTLVVENTFHITATTIDVNYCGFVYLIAQLDTYDEQDADPSNQIQLVKFDYNCFNDILQIVDRSVNISWFQYPVQAGVSTRLSLQVSVASLAPDISRDISDAVDGTPNIKFLVTSSSDFAGTEDVLRITDEFATVHSFVKSFIILWIK